MPELFIGNPMTPLDSDSYWSKTLLPYFAIMKSRNVSALIESGNDVFESWKKRFKTVSEIAVPYPRPYFIGEGRLLKTAGLVQIKDYAMETSDAELQSKFHELQKCLKIVKSDFFELVTEKLSYFGENTSFATSITIPEKTKFEKVLCRRLAVAGILVQQLNRDPNFGRTKLAKLFYLANMHEHLDLETEYYREAAGPLDQRALYNERFGIEALAQKYQVFRALPKIKMVTYDALPNMQTIEAFAKKHLGEKVENIIAMATAFRGLTTDQAEIIATLYACWNDLLIKGRPPTDDEIATEFLHHWHPKKSRFTRARLLKALAWMRSQDWVPDGKGKTTKTKLNR